MLFALEEYPHATELIDREFSEPSDLADVLTLVQKSNGIQRSRDLAKIHAKLAVNAIEWLPTSVHKKSLLDLTDYVLERLY
jgi:all-trans-nonaprenyl-diphosphate synthase